MQRSVLDYLEQSADRFADKTVFADNENSITYREFRKQAKAVACGLITHAGIGRNRPVIVLIERKIESLAAFFGVVYSGNFYVPVDFSMPAKRIELMIETLQPEAVIVTEKTKRIMGQISCRSLQARRLTRENWMRLQIRELIRIRCMQFLLPALPGCPRVCWFHIVQ